MLTIPYIREHKEECINRLSIKNFTRFELLDEIIALDDERRKTQQENDEALAEANNIARKVGELCKQGKAAEATPLKVRVAELKELTKVKSERLDELKELIQSKLLEIPNTPNMLVPRGKTAADNLIVTEEGKMPELPSNAMPHWDLLNKYQLADFELGNKVTGAGFPFYKGQGARLQRALINFFLDEAVADGYFEVQPPILVNEESAYATGQLPDKEAQMYAVPLDKMYMIPTAEVPVTNIFRNQIVQESQLPIKTVAYSNCFRREAGSWGKNVRGLNRLHQFDKVEIVRIEKPEDSYAALDDMIAHVEAIVKSLGLPYRILRLCGGDMSFTSAITYDFEVYSAAQGRWLEISSVSNFESYQANRLKLRYKDADGKTQLAHTLNGSSLALPRVVAALLENNQKDGRIWIPEALRPYTGFDYID